MLSQGLSTWSRRLSTQRARSGLAAAVALLAAAYFLYFMNGIRPISGWLVLDLFKLWTYELFASLAWLLFGHFLLSFLDQGELSLLERLAYSSALGVLGFVVAIYLGGFAHLLGSVFAIAMPLVLIAIGATRARPLFQECLAALKGAGPPSLTAGVASAFGLLCLFLLYLGVLSPESVNYDAGWNHLVIAQDYAREGRIIGFPGDWVKNVPHLSSVLNSWAFMVPGLPHPALRWMQALHNEFCVFLWTLVGVAAGIRVLSERAGVRGAWAAFFLFPSIFVYDGNMGGSADHFLALFAVPILLAGLRTCQRLRWQEAVLFGAFAGAGLLTKLHAVYLLIPITGLIAARVALLAYRTLRKEPEVVTFGKAAVALSLGALTAVALCALHFGKNWALFGNPFFPLAQGTFQSHPTVADAQEQMDYLFADWRFHPPGALGQRIEAALKMVFTFSFVPHYTFIGDLPTFGSLLTLTLPLQLFLGKVRKLWFATAVVLAALFVWAMTFWVDRNLQTFLPVMVVVTGAVLARTWELGRMARVGAIALVAAQLVWGADWYFSGSERITNAIALIRSSMDGRAAKRYETSRRDYVALEKWLPADAHVLLHTQHVMLGIDRPVTLDWIGFQGVVDYRPLQTVREVDALYRRLGITHVLWTNGIMPASKQELILFQLYATRLDKAARAFGGLRVAPLPEQPPPATHPLTVLSFGVAPYANGLYPIRALGVNESMPPAMQRFPAPLEPAASNPELLLERASVALTGAPASLPAQLRDALRGSFKNVGGIANVTVWQRKD